MKTKFLALFLAFVLTVSSFGSVVFVSANDNTETTPPADTETTVDYDALAVAEGYVVRIGEAEAAYDNGAFTGYYKFLTASDPGFVTGDIDAATYATSNDVVYLLKDIEYTKPAQFSGAFTVDGQNKFTLTGDFGQKIVEPLTGSNMTFRNLTIWQQGTHGTIQLSGGALTCTLQNVKMLSTNAVPYASVIMNANDQTLNLEDCEIIMISDDAVTNGDKREAAIRTTFDNATLNMKNTTVDTLGCTQNYRRGMYFYSEGGTLTIDNCDFKTSHSAVVARGCVATITDSNFYSSHSEILLKGKDAADAIPVLQFKVKDGGKLTEVNFVTTAKMSGGSKPLDIAAEIVTAASMDYEDGKTTAFYISNDDIAAAGTGMVARVGKTYYKFLSPMDANYVAGELTAIDAADGAPITLIADVSITSNFIPTKNVSINGAGHTLTTTKYLRTDPGLTATFKNLVIKTEANIPIVQVNAGGSATYVACDFITTGVPSYAYFVARTSLTLIDCTLTATATTDANPSIFFIDQPTELVLENFKADLKTSAPAFSAFKVAKENVKITMLGDTLITTGAYAIHKESTASKNLTLVMSDNAKIDANDNALYLPGAGTNVTLNDNAAIVATKDAIRAAAACTITLNDSASITGARNGLKVEADDIVVNVNDNASINLVKSDASVAAITADRSEGTVKATINLYGGTVNAEGAPAVLLNKGATLLVNGAEINVTGTADAFEAAVIINDATLKVLDGTITTAIATAPAILGKVAESKINLHGAIVNGGSKPLENAGTGNPTTDYAAGTTTHEFNPLLQNVPVMESTSLRMVEGSYGMRFTATIPAALVDYADELIADGTITAVAYGTLIARESEVKRMDAITLETLAEADATHLHVVAADGITENQDGSLTINTAIVNLKESTYQTKLTAITYVCYTLADGTTKYVYANERSEATMMEDLAEEALADVKKAPEAGYENWVSTYLEKDGTAYEEVTGVAYSCYSKAQRELLKQFID